jgi:hypothetical protein
MVLSPTLKFTLIAAAFTIQLCLLAWTGIKIDVLALGMRDEVFNIGLTLLTILNAGAFGLLSYLGLKAPTSGAGDGSGTS